LRQRLGIEFQQRARRRRRAAVDNAAAEFATQFAPELPEPRRRAGVRRQQVEGDGLIAAGHRKTAIQGESAILQRHLFAQAVAGAVAGRQLVGEGGGFQRGIEARADTRAVAGEAQGHGVEVDQQGGGRGVVRA